MDQDPSFPQSGLLYDSLPLGIVVQNAAGEIMSANPGAERILGLTLAEMRGVTSLDPRWQALGEDGSPLEGARHPSMVALATGQPVRNVVMGLCNPRTRTRNWIKVSAIPIPAGSSGGHPCSGVYTVFEDITEHRLSHDRLLVAAKRYQRMLGTTKDAFWLADARTGRLLDVNESAVAMLGYPRERMLGMTLADFAIDPDEFLRHMARIKAAGGDILETRQRRATGEVVDVEVSITHDPESQTYVAYLRDVTERRRAVRALRESERRLRRELERNRYLLQAATDGIHVIDEQGYIILANPAFASGLGYSIDAAVGLHVADFDTAFAAGEEPIALRDWLERREPFTFETRHRRADGIVCEVEVTARSVLLDGHRVLFASARNIGERKKADATLRLSQFTLDNASDAIYWVRPDGSIFYANEAACRMLGYDRETLLGLSVADLDPDYRGELWQDTWQACQEHRSLCLVSRHRTRDGRVVPIEVRANYLRHDHQEYACAIVRDISARIAAEEKLRASEARLARAVRGTSDGLWDWNLTTHEDYHSPRYRELLGYAADELADNLEGFLAIVHPEDRSRVQAAQRAHLDLGEPYDIEFRLRTRAGDYRWFRSRGQAECDAAGHPVMMAGAITDIHDWKRNLDALRASEQAHRELIDRLTLAARVARFGVWDWDTRHDVISWDDTMFLIYGLEEPVPVSFKVWARAVHPDDYPAVAASLQRILRDQRPDTLDFRIRRPDGTIRYLSSAQSPVLDEQGRAARIVGVNIDVTEHKLALRALEEARRQAEAANHAKSQFLAHMSHEIRTPLNAVLGLSQLLGQEPLSPGQAAMVRHIHESGDNLLHIINDILDFSKIEAGQLRMDAEPFEPGAVLARIGNLLGNSARAKGLVLELADETRNPGRLLGDALRLEQVLINLTSNAIKFTQRGSVHVAVTLLASGPSCCDLRFVVADTGIGIAPEALAGLFQPFRQADASITRRFGGTGLGLAISKRLVDLMGGRLGAESVPGQGSTFWFEVSFPRVGAQVESPAERAPTGAGRAGQCLDGLRVLAVDDNRINLMVVERALKNQGARVALAADGQQALQMLKAQPDGYDVVIMDVQMPVMDGLTATREIRRTAGLASLPVVALTAGVLAEERDAAMRAGVDGFLAKPLDLEQMNDLLARYLSRPVPRVRSAD